MQNPAMPWVATADAVRAGRAADRDGFRAIRGLAAHSSGHSAEGLAAIHYQGRGCTILERCWRSPAGEVDLILRDGAQIVFVEVKKAETHEIAATRLSRRQMDRICTAALLYADTLPSGSLTDIRFDAALVDCQGRVSVLENAFGTN